RRHLPRLAPAGDGDFGAPPVREHGMRGSVSHRGRTALTHIVLIAAAAILIVPVAWTIAAGFRTQISLLRGEFVIKLAWFNFAEVLFSKTSDFLLNYRNSIIVGVTSTALCLVVATLAAWSLHRMRWPGWVVHIFLAWALIFHMIPPVALASAWYTMARSVGLDNTFTALILAHTTLNLPMALCSGRVFALGVPWELDEADSIDGRHTTILL